MTLLTQVLIKSLQSLTLPTNLSDLYNLLEKLFNLFRVFFLSNWLESLYEKISVAFLKQPTDLLVSDHFETEMQWGEEMHTTRHVNMSAGVSVPSL